MTTIIDSCTETVLNYDPVSVATNFFKKPHEDFSSIEQSIALSDGISNNLSKTEFLKSLNDTHFGMSWDYFINLIQENGFVEGLSYDFEYAMSPEKAKPEDWSTEKAILFYHPTKGLVIWANSYNGQKTVNEGKMYGEVRYTGTITKKQVPSSFRKGTLVESINITDEIDDAFKALDRCNPSSIQSIGTGSSIEYSVREGLINKIALIESKWAFNPKWVNPQRLWLVDYVESKGSYYDSEFLSLEKINRSNEELQNILQVCREELHKSLVRRGFLD